MITKLILKYKGSEYTDKEFIAETSLSFQPAINTVFDLNEADDLPEDVWCKKWVVNESKITMIGSIEQQHFLRLDIVLIPS